MEFIYNVIVLVEVDMVFFDDEDIKCVIVVVLDSKLLLVIGCWG